VKDLGLLDAVLDPSRFSGIPYWTKRACLQKSIASKVLDSQAILEHAYGLNAYWQSFRGQEAGDAYVRGSSKHICQTSVWHRLLKHAEAEGGQFGEEHSTGTPAKKHKAVADEGQLAIAKPLWPPPLIPESRSCCSSIAAVSQCKIFDAYELLTEVGHGTFGTCYKAKQKSTGCIAVAKVTRSGDMHHMIPFTEHYLQKMCECPNAVAILDVYWSPYYSIILMELCGESLRSLCDRREAAFGDKPVAAIFRDVARGAAHMHEKNVMHRDLHVGNILVDNAIKPQGQIQRNEFKVAKIADFGKAIEFLSAESPGSTFKGTGTCGAADVIPPRNLVQKRHRVGNQTCR
jgi:hypothetical protein